MLFKYNACIAFDKTISKMVEWEDINNTTPITNQASIDHYDHLVSMSEYLLDGIALGVEEVMLNIAEVNSLVKKLN